MTRTLAAIGIAIAFGALPAAAIATPDATPDAELRTLADAQLAAMNTHELAPFSIGITGVTLSQFQSQLPH